MVTVIQSSSGHAVQNGRARREKTKHGILDTIDPGASHAEGAQSDADDFERVRSGEYGGRPEMRGGIISDYPTSTD